MYKKNTYTIYKNHVQPANWRKVYREGIIGITKAWREGWVRREGVREGGREGGEGREWRDVGTEWGMKGETERASHGGHYKDTGRE